MKKDIKEFKKDLLNCCDLKIRLKGDGIECFNEATFDELIDKIDEIIHEDSDVEEEIEALGAYDDVFYVTVRSYSGILFWIQANEFEDIKYLASKEDAMDYAYDEFSTYISGMVKINEMEEACEKP